MINHALEVGNLLQGIARGLISLIFESSEGEELGICIL